VSRFAETVTAFADMILRYRSLETSLLYNIFASLAIYFYQKKLIKRIFVTLHKLYCVKLLKVPLIFSV